MILCLVIELELRYKFNISQARRGKIGKIIIKKMKYKRNTNENENYLKYFLEKVCERRIAWHMSKVHQHSL